MCESMVDIQSATAAIRRGKKEEEETTGQKYNLCTTQGGHTKKIELECGPVPNLMVALPNIGDALCLTPQSLTDAHY